MAGVRNAWVIHHGPVNTQNPGSGTATDTTYRKVHGREAGSHLAGAKAAGARFSSGSRDLPVRTGAPLCFDLRTRAALC